MVLIQKTTKGGQDSAYSFLNARNREDAAQRLQRFVHWKVSQPSLLTSREVRNLATSRVGLFLHQSTFVR
jgi:hypothetical protein